MFSFEIKIKTSIGSRTFIFKRVYSANGDRYYVSVFGRITNNYFSLIRDGDGWVFSRPEFVPDWIAEVQFELMDAIEENEIR